MPELQDLLDEWIVAALAEPAPRRAARPGAPGRAFTPNEKYAALVEAAGYVPVALSAEDYIELLPAPWQAINAYGIKINHRIYDSAELNPLRRQPSGVREEEPVGGPPRPLRRLPGSGCATTGTAAGSPALEAPAPRPGARSGNSPGTTPASSWPPGRAATERDRRRGRRAAAPRPAAARAGRRLAAKPSSKAPSKRQRVAARTTRPRPPGRSRQLRPRTPIGRRPRQRRVDPSQDAPTIRH